MRFLIPITYLILFLSSTSSFTNQTSRSLLSFLSQEKVQDIPLYPIDEAGITWGDFLSTKPWFPNTDRDILGVPLKKAFNSVANLRMCGADVVANITKKLSTSEIKWCQWALNPKGGDVRIGESYGKLTPHEAEKFEYLDCQAVARGLDLSCDDMWGDGFLQAWKRNKVSGLCDDAGANSKITCYDSAYPVSRFCVFENAMMNFKRTRIMSRSDGNPYRAFEKGFLAADCGYTAKENIGYLQIYKPDIDGSTDAVCDYTFNETVIAYSHDNIKNLGHSMLADFMNVWTMMWLSGNSRKSKDITLLNIDGIFKSTHYNGDKTNQYFRTYEVNFHSIIRASQFGADATVCFKKLITQPKPAVPFTKDGWLRDTRCSANGPSSLFQRWNLQVRNSYGLLQSQGQTHMVTSSDGGSLNQEKTSSVMRRSGGAIRGHSSDPAPLALTREYKVLLILRSQHRGRHSGGTNRTESALNLKETSRYFANQGEIIQALKAFADASTNIDFVYFDLNKMSFESQVRLMSNMSIVIGMHGAGIASSMHMPVGTPHCCGVVEVFPPGEFVPVRGYSNMARRMGHHYTRIELGRDSYVEAGMTSVGVGVGIGGVSASAGKVSNSMKKSGSVVQPSVLIESIQYMMNMMTSKPSCFLPSVLKSPL